METNNAGNQMKINSMDTLTQADFYRVASRDLIRAVWLAKYFGIAEDTVKAWVRGLIAAYKN